MLKVLKKTRKAKKENEGMKKEEKKKWEKKLKPCEEEDHNSDETIIIGSNESHDFLWEWTIDIPWYEMIGWEGRASGHIGCKSHFHTWLGSEFESCMWLAICKNMSNRFGK
jgi:hypothetical protein